MEWLILGAVVALNAFFNKSEVEGDSWQETERKRKEAEEAERRFNDRIERAMWSHKQGPY